MTARDRAPTVHEPGVLRIPLTKGLFALIDETDAPLIVPHLWGAHIRPHTYYACRKIGGRVNATTVYMHQVILGLERGTDVDHIDGNGWNNVRSNLRRATRSQNLGNARLRADSQSGFKGVSRYRKNPGDIGRWVAMIGNGGKTRNLGYFDTPEEAARAYDVEARRVYGAFARPNFPQ